MKDNNQEIFPLVDEAGNVTGSATRGVCHNGSHLLHPVVHLHVFNSRGEVYLQKRPDWKDIQPGKWDTAVGARCARNWASQLLSRSSLGSMSSPAAVRVNWSMSIRPFTTVLYAPLPTNSTAAVSGVFKRSVKPSVRTSSPPTLKANSSASFCSEMALLRNSENLISE